MVYRIASYRNSAVSMHPRVGDRDCILSEYILGIIKLDLASGINNVTCMLMYTHEDLMCCSYRCLRRQHMHH